MTRGSRGELTTLPAPTRCVTRRRRRKTHPNRDLHVRRTPGAHTRRPAVTQRDEKPSVPVGRPRVQPNSRRVAPRNAQERTGSRYKSRAEESKGKGKKESRAFTSADNPGLMFGASRRVGWHPFATRDERRVNRDLRALKKGFCQVGAAPRCVGHFARSRGGDTDFRDATATVDDVRGARGSSDGGGPPPVPRRSI